MRSGVADVAGGSGLAGLEAVHGDVEVDAVLCDCAFEASPERALDQAPEGGHQTQ
jgi:hypothetical protein